LTREKKAELIDFLTSEFKTAQGIVVCDYKGLTVKQLEALRKEARVKSVKVKVIKNSLADIALKSAGINGLELKETNIIVWGSEQLDVAKVVAKYADSASDKFAIKTGYMDGSIVDAKSVDALSKLPSKEELIGMLLSVWMAPVRNFTIGLDALRQKKEEAN